MKEEAKKMSEIFVVLSAFAAVFAGWGALMQKDIWLAPTQWMLVAILLAVYSIYLKK